MILRRLKENEKIEILESYRVGISTVELAKKYNCTSSTINRTVKTLLSEDEFSVLKEKRLKANKNKNESYFARDNDYETNKKETQLFISQRSENTHDDYLKEITEEFHTHQVSKSSALSLTDTESIDFDSQNEDNNNFQELAPLVSSFGFESEEQKVDIKILDKDSLPECVYMIVDKKVELEYQLISDLPEWSFLSENEKKRYAIKLYADQRSAKRNCSRSQRVIKIKNTKVFQISKSYLLLKGITRLIIDTSLISLDD